MYFSGRLVNSAQSNEVKSIDGSDFIYAFSQQFTQHGEANDHKIEFDVILDKKVNQQKRRLVALQLQESVWVDMERLSHELNIDKIRTVKDKMFIQPTVCTVKKKTI